TSFISRVRKLLTVVHLLQLPDPDIFIIGFIAMILQSNKPLFSLSVIGISFPFTGRSFFMPRFCPGFKRHYLFSVQPVLNLSFIKNNPAVVPFTYRLQLFICISGMHGIIGAGLLP